MLRPMIHPIAGCIQNVAFAGIWVFKTPRVSMRMKSILMITPGNRTLARVEGCRSIFSRQGAKTLNSELIMRL